MAKVKLNRSGVAALLQSTEVETHLRGKADAIAAAAGEGFEADSNVGRNRARASVRTTTWDAAYAEAKDKVLTSAIGAGRG